VETSIETTACGHGFGNDDGQLVCDDPPNAAGIPDGSYSQSCGGCTLQNEGKSLSCTHCSSSDGKKESAIGVEGCAKIGNHNGVLTCEEYTKAAAAGRRLEEDATDEDAQVTGDAPPADAKQDL